MTVDHLHRFLIEIEGEDKATKEDAESIMESVNELKHLNIFHRKGLHLEAFFYYLFSDSNPPLSPSSKYGGSFWLWSHVFIGVVCCTRVHDTCLHLCLPSVWTSVEESAVIT
ncbi:Phosphoinositide phospholipase C 2 [Camellia lanceoleosa]|uniref:Phosphoinositide phospholipase C 2 n=1 Tax=Camellia lanceoleosa TaxID=1840588 RepID=A0ACC0GL13_9ERIC|nr:Phosphoinositide phospholipase C 2 [Camellia lanceoleosa]